MPTRWNENGEQMNNDPFERWVGDLVSSPESSQEERNVKRRAVSLGSPAVAAVSASPGSPAMAAAANDAMPFIASIGDALAAAAPNEIPEPVVTSLAAASAFDAAGAFIGNAAYIADTTCGFSFSRGVAKATIDCESGKINFNVVAANKQVFNCCVSGNIDLSIASEVFFKAGVRHGPCIHGKISYSKFDDMSNSCCYDGKFKVTIKTSEQGGEIIFALEDDHGILYGSIPGNVTKIVEGGRCKGIVETPEGCLGEFDFLTASETPNTVALFDLHHEYEGEF
jgi:hypothetical protein